MSYLGVKLSPVAIGIIAIAGAAPATANTVAVQFGSAQHLTVGPAVVEYTIDAPHPSTDHLNVPVSGQLYEADTTVKALQGATAPAIPLFNARSASGDTYRVLFQATTAASLNPAPLTQGQQSSGKLYFDVTGPVPTEIFYSDTMQDTFVWET